MLVDSLWWRQESSKSKPLVWACSCQQKFYLFIGWALVSGGPQWWHSSSQVFVTCWCQISSSTFTAFCSLHRFNSIFTKEIPTPGNSGPHRCPTNAQQLIHSFLSFFWSLRKVCLPSLSNALMPPPTASFKRSRSSSFHFHAQASFRLTLVHLPAMLRYLPPLNSWPALAYLVHSLSQTFRKRSYCS